MLMAALALGLLAGCGGGGEKEQELSVEEIVPKTRETTSALRSFHFVFNAENAPTAAAGLNLTFAEGDLVVPDRLRADIAGGLSGVQLTSELVIVGEEDFLKDPFRGDWVDLNFADRKIAAKLNALAEDPLTDGQSK